MGCGCGGRKAVRTVKGQKVVNTPVAKSSAREEAAKVYQSGTIRKPTLQKRKVV